MHWRDPDAAPADRATAVELFFDIVFVFTLTQLSRTLEGDLSWGGAGRVLLVFGVLWWMYGGYAWLTNHVPPRRISQKLLLFTAMAGFLVAAIGIPRAFETTGIVFGVGYLVVISVHLLLFTQSGALGGVARLAPFNLAAALLILFAGTRAGAVLYVSWIAALLLMTVASSVAPRHTASSHGATFHLSPEHFIERHGLLVIIALGESVIAIGAGVDVEHLTAATIAAVVLALVLPAALWWTYFTDASAAEHALGRAEPARRNALAVRAYYFAHIPLLLGIIGAAAGLHGAIAHPGDAAGWPGASALGGGVALYLLGVGDVRRVLAIATPTRHFLAAVVAVATIPLGAFGVAVAQLSVLALIVLGVIVSGPRVVGHDVAV
jgi:low temperature requirement protein LtrA